MAFKKWIVGHPDKNIAQLASNELDIDPFSALLLCTRGIKELDDMELFLTDEPILADPHDLTDIEKAADCINEAIESGLKIAIFGDYDCDGVVATAIMYKYLISRGADVVTYIPDRINEGYGMNKTAIDALNEQGVQFIVTVDNGVAATEEISYAASLGIVTVVTDHHIPPEVLPDAAAVVDPHRQDDYSSFKDVCGAYVAFKVICVAENKEPEEMLYDYADLVAVATVGDVMPLVNENRSIVKQGITRIRQNSNLGLSALLSVSGVDRDTVDGSKVSFGIVPRLNAAGRMGNAQRAFNLLISDNMIDALKIANEIEDENQTRQKAEKTILSSAIKTIETEGYSRNRVIVVSGENYHLGIVGIVAARICEKYGRPAIVLSSDGVMAHGSGRSITGFNLFEAIKNTSGYLERFGGHELAAGVSLKPDNIDEFRRAINDYALEREIVLPSINIDFKINPQGLSMSMVDAIKALEPFGNANSTPIFGLFNVVLQKISPIGQGKHLRLLFEKNGSSFQSLLFNVTADDFCFNVGDSLDLAVNLDTNTYKGVTSLSVIIKAIKPSYIDDDKIFGEMFTIDDYLSGYGSLNSLPIPTRGQIGEVYKFIQNGNCRKEKIIYNFINSLGYFLTEISIIILKELTLIEEKAGVIMLNNNRIKRELSDSDTYLELLRGGGIHE